MPANRLAARSTSGVEETDIETGVSTGRAIHAATAALRTTGPSCTTERPRAPSEPDEEADPTPDRSPAAQHPTPAIAPTRASCCAFRADSAATIMADAAERSSAPTSGPSAKMSRATPGSPGTKSKRNSPPGPNAKSVASASTPAESERTQFATAAPHMRATRLVRHVQYPDPRAAFRRARLGANDEASTDRRANGLFVRKLIIGELAASRPMGSTRGHTRHSRR